MASCLVVGGNGFLGAHLVDMLVASGHDVSAFDRFSTGTARYESRTVTPIVGDYQDRSHLARAVSGQEYVFHFLSTTSPVTAQNDPTLDIRTNLTQTVDLLQSSALAGVRRVFFASTGGAIYGTQSKPSYSEDDPTWPVSPYGIVKLAIENYLRYFQAAHQLDYTIFRISNPYGSRQDPSKPQGLIPVVLNRVMNQLPVTRYGDGSMVRDFIHTDDLMEMIRRIVHGSPKHAVYNLGHGEGHSVNEILDAVRAVTRQEITVAQEVAPPTFVRRSVLDVARFTSEFGGIDYVPLRDGIQRTWDWLKAPAPVPGSIQSIRRESSPTLL